MGWVRLDDGFADHPKILEAGDAAAGLFCRMLCWCNRHKTDGVIPATKLRQFSAKKRTISRLISAGLLTESGPNSARILTIHDYLDYQPSREEIEKKQAETSSKRSKAGRRGAMAKWQKPWQNDDTLPETVYGPNPTQPNPIKSKPLASSDSKKHRSQPTLLPASPTAFLLPLNKGEHAVTEADLAEWVEAYPGIDLLQQLRQMNQWLKANPERRKTARGVRAFIVRWLGKAQDQSRGNGRPNGKGDFNPETHYRDEYGRIQAKPPYLLNDITAKMKQRDAEKAAGLTKKQEG